MEFNLELKHTAFNSIFQALVHLNNAIVSKDHDLFQERIKDWKIISCSAFVNYLLEKARSNEIIK